MAGNAGAAAQIANIVIQDYLDRGPESAYCQYLELIDEGPGGWHPAVGFARTRLCEPPPPPPRPTEEFFNNGGTPCRDYRVQFESGTPGSPGSVSELNAKGPIGMITRTRVDPNGAINKLFTLTSGDGIGCPRLYQTMAGTSDARFVDIYARIISITPLDGLPTPDIPVWIPPVQPPNPPNPPFGIEIEVNVDGVDINAPLRFGPVIETNFGPTVQIGFSPTANFNPQIDIDLGINPTFGLDIDLEFVLPFVGDPKAPAPPAGQPPIPLPPVSGPPSEPCPEFDYERIEDKIEESSCCKPVDGSDFLGSFAFENPNDVYQVSVPDNAVFVVLTIVPDNNSRRYKLAGDDSEIALGNASVTSDGKAMTYGKVWLRRQIFSVPENLPNKGFRVSLKQGCFASVEALTHAI